MKANDLTAHVTSQIIDAIEAGAETWKMPWHALADAGTPVSVERRPYRGFNAFWLPMVAAANAWPSGVWATYKAWQGHGAQVRKGEKGTSVILWLPVTAASSKDAKDDETPGGPGGKTRLIARGYTVFAAEQADNSEERVKVCRGTEQKARNAPERITAAEEYFHAIDAVVKYGGNRACYEPAADVIRCPELAQFTDAVSFYGTLAHEHAHWTGHASRLNRDLAHRFGTHAYAAEELIAELAAALWCAQAGLSATPRPDHAAYLAGWLKVLRTDARALTTVASRAQAAVDLLNKRAYPDRITPTSREAVNA